MIVQSVCLYVSTVLRTTVRTNIERRSLILTATLACSLARCAAAALKIEFVGKRLNAVCTTRLPPPNLYQPLSHYHVNNNQSEATRRIVLVGSIWHDEEIIGNIWFRKWEHRRRRSSATRSKCSRSSNSTHECFVRRGEFLGLQILARIRYVQYIPGSTYQKAPPLNKSRAFGNERTTGLQCSLWN